MQRVHSGHFVAHQRYMHSQCQHTAWHHQQKKVDVVRACFNDGKWTAASKADALLYNWEEESGKTIEEMDREHKGRCRHKKHRIWGSDRHGDDRVEWRRLVAASSSVSWQKREKEEEIVLHGVSVVSLCYDAEKHPGITNGTDGCFRCLSS